MKISRSSSMRRLPLIIADDLRLIIPGRARGIHLSPADAMAIGNRLARQAALADPTLVAQPKAAATSKRARKKEHL